MFLRTASYESAVMAKPPSRSRSRNASNGTLDGAIWFSARLFWIVFHALLCLAALVLGFRLSGEAYLSTGTPASLHLRRSSSSWHEEGMAVALKFPYIADTLGDSGSKTIFAPKDSKDHVLHDHNSSRFQYSPAKEHPPSRDVKTNQVHVGRHKILIRPQLHPDPDQSIRAHNLLDRIQHEQRLLYDLDAKKQLLVITPTFVRTFQALHLTCLMHTLRSVQNPLIWIVVEAGGESNETAALLSRSHLPFHHLGFPQEMPSSLEDQSQMEVRLRMGALRFLQEKRLDGIVLFVDDSSTHSLDFFNEARKTKWMGALSIGLLTDSSTVEKQFTTNFSSFPVQGPVCNTDGHITGWYIPSMIATNQETYEWRALKWAGFSLNAKLLWEDYDKPAGFKNWNELFELKKSSIQSPLDFARNVTLVEPLGDCGRSVLLWSLRVEARADSKFPPRWDINPGLQIVVPSKRTPWPDPPPPRKRESIPSPIFSSSSEKQRGKQNGKIRRMKKYGGVHLAGFVED